MNLGIVLAFLFFIGALLGWWIELFFRRLVNKQHKWVNPGFCVGPYLPIYGIGLCVLFLLAYCGTLLGIDGSLAMEILLFIFMAACMTLIEFIGGMILLKGLKLRLWDYRNLWGNVQGVICPLFSFFWAVISAVYYFLIHDHILNALAWLSNNLTFSFVIGFFFGVFVIDVIYSARVVARLKAFADEKEIIIKYEILKDQMREQQEILREHAQQKAPHRITFHVALDEATRDKLSRAMEEALKQRSDAIEGAKKRKEAAKEEAARRREERKKEDPKELLDDAREQAEEWLDDAAQWWEDIRKNTKQHPKKKSKKDSRKES